MAINFPSATSVGETYTDPTSGSTFVCVVVGPPAQWVGSGSSTSLDNTYLRKDASNDPVTGQLEITPATDTTGLVVTQPSGNTAAAMRVTNEGSGDSLVIEDSANPDFSPFVITSSGSVGVGTASPAEQLDVSAAGNILISNKTAAPINFQSLPGSLIFGGKGWNTATGSEDIQGAIGLAGNYTAGTGIVSPSLTFSVKSSATGSSLTERMKIDSNGTMGMSTGVIGVFNAIDLDNPDATGNGRGSSITLGPCTIRHFWEGTAQELQLLGSDKITLYTNTDVGKGYSTRNLYVSGALSKGSGSFKIAHPLPSKNKTHYLVHSFIEGPQADLIYRGQAALVDGRAIINIDDEARMTEGTFEALCANVCCFTSNESDWTAVRGTVQGNILTIEAQDPASTAKVCWMVIGERKDQHILDTEWTDEFGRVITEPLIPEDQKAPPASEDVVQ